MKTKILQVIFLLIFSAFLFSCENDSEDSPPDPLNGYTKLEDGYAIGASAKVELWGRKNFFMGYNKLVVVLYDSLNLKEKITDAHIHFMPVMTMSMDGMPMQHAAPVENPESLSLWRKFARYKTELSEIHQLAADVASCRSCCFGQSPRYHFLPIPFRDGICPGSNF